MGKIGSLLQFIGMAAPYQSWHSYISCHTCYTCSRATTYISISQPCCIIAVAEFCFLLVACFFSSTLCRPRPTQYSHYSIENT